MAHLLKYDSVLGNLPNDISAIEGGISIDGQLLKVLPSETLATCHGLIWKSMLLSSRPGFSPIGIKLLNI